MPVQVDIYSDIVCPWCYIGHRRFLRALEAAGLNDDVEVRLRPYQLDPGAPATAEPLSAYLARRFGRPVDGMFDAVNQAAAGEDLSFAWDRALSANTRLAHRLVAFAGREAGAGAQRALLERLFALHFSEGGNIADIDQLADAAVAVGLDRDRVRQHLASDEGVPELDAAFDEARSLGIRAVPTFVFNGRHALQGAQPFEVFIGVLQELTETDRTPHASS